MAIFRKEKGEVILESDELSLKVASDRFIYVKKKGASNYINTDVKMPLGLKRIEKEKKLSDIREYLIKKNNLSEE